MPDSAPWRLYIVRCRDGTLYTGITNDLDRRIRDHNRGKGCRYTKCRRPVRLVHTESFPDKGGALRREAQIKGWSRREKTELISQTVYPADSPTACDERTGPGANTHATC
ncbi:MAG: GIY-YIG nuclease family protein [bacterium]|nr:GIY-YIG nuclease family protein [bacterium]